MAVVRRELEIIHDDPHANAVRLTGSDLGRLDATARAAVELGLEVWYSPAFYEYSPADTAARLVAAATTAGALERDHQGRVIFVAGSELTLFMTGLVPGASVSARLAGLMVGAQGTGAMGGTEALNAFLARLAPDLRGVFGGSLTYASLVFEKVDWARPSTSSGWTTTARRAARSATPPCSARTWRPASPSSSPSSGCAPIAAPRAPGRSASAWRT
jgi:hypothetical protein